MSSLNLHRKIIQLEDCTSAPVINLTPQSHPEQKENNYFDFLKVISDSLNDMSTYSSVPISDDLIAEVEGLGALLLTLQGCSDYMSTSAAIILYIRRYFKTSLSSQLIKYISETFEPQSGEIAPTPQWLNLVRNIRENWTLCKGNKLFGHFSKLLGLVVALGLCKASDVTFDLGKFRTFEPDLKVVHGSATDIADAALNTVTFFVESMYMCFKHRSFRPLLLGNQQAVEMDEEYVNVLSFWTLVKTGNLEKVQGISDQEFDRRLENITNEIKNLMTTKSSFEKKLLSDKYNKLVDIRNDYTTLKISSGVRRRPFAIELFGESSQGKTTVGDQIVDALFASAELPLGKEYRASYNPSDKFMSNWSTDKLAMFVDDMANDKSKFVERPPTRVVIDLCNNQPYYANMAELDKKGKVFVEPEVVIVSTNVLDLDAYTYSNCPYSIQRRMDIVIEVKAKKAVQRKAANGTYCGLDSTLAKDYNDTRNGDKTFDDLWDLTLKRAVKPQKMSTTATYEVISWNGKKMKDVSFEMVLNYLIEKFHAHRAEQFEMLTRNADRTTEFQLCGVDGCKQIKNCCLKHKHDKQFGEEIERSLQKAVGLVRQRVDNDVSYASTCIEGATTLALMASAKYIVRQWDWISFIPQSFLLNDTFFKGMMFFNKNHLKNVYFRHTFANWFLFFAMAWIFTLSWYPLILCHLFVCISYQRALYDKVINKYRQELLNRNTIAPAFQTIRDNYTQHICGAVGVIGILYSLAKIYRRWKTFSTQGSLEPTTVEEVEARDAEANPWISVEKRTIVANEDQLCTTITQLENLISKNLVYGTVVVNDNRKLMVNGLFLKSNVVVIPNHYFEEDVLDVTFRKVNPETVGGKFATRISKDASIRIPDTDLCICYSSTGGSFKDLTKYLPNGNCGTFEFKMLYREKDGNLLNYAGVATDKLTSNGVCTFEGGEYDTLSGNTFDGMCGATVIKCGKSNVIAGFHLGGKAGTTRGCYGRLTQTQAYSAYNKLKEIPGILLTGTAEKFEKQVLGVNIMTGSKLHTKSPLNYLPENCQLEYYGSCIGQTTSRSDVKVLSMSEHVMDVMDAPNIYCAPKFYPEWFGWQKCLENMSVPALPYRHDILSMAVRDYEEPLMEIFKKSMWNNARPLTDHENLNGIPGKRFMDAIKLDTAIGFPLTGKKRRFVTELPPTEDKPNNRVFDEVIMDEINRCLDCYTRGERAYTIAKAQKKDEVLSKEKCRIYYANPVSLTYNVRKYFLPIMRVLQMNPLKAECAVGINKDGPEWDQFHNHVTKHGMDRLIGGDYGKYDQKLPAQLILAGIRILIDFAKECDYTEEDIGVMEAMAGDLAYSLIAFNGDLVGLTEGSHISGNSLTAVLNGICGSLNLRACFYTNNPATSFEERIPFQKVVAMMTYGDDNIGSVSSEIDNFTIKGISQFLADFGQTYTMPDKESELLDFLPPEDFEFLKCTSVYHDALGVNLGALAEKSIFKSLHCYLDTNDDMTMEMRCAENLDGALRTWFAHGPEVYERRRQHVIEVAERAGVSHLCREVEKSYDDRVIAWRKNYLRDNDFQKQSGVELTPLPEDIYVATECALSDSDTGTITSERSPEDLYVKAIREIPLKVVARDAIIINQALGEVDLVFQHMCFGVNNFVYVEVKSSHTKTNRSKGRKQLRKLCDAMALLNPKCSHIGILLNDEGYHYVRHTGVPSTLSNEALPMFNLI